MAVALFGLLSACTAPDPEPPDLFLITIDALATDRLACFEGPADASPALCALARGGTLARWAVSDAWGEASAAASVLTGRSPQVHGVGDQGASFLREHVLSLAEHLTRAGYATAAFVESPRLNRSRRMDQGFLTYEDHIGPEPTDLPGTLARRIGEWFDHQPAPRFVWIHAKRSEGIEGLDSLITRLDRQLQPGSRANPGVFFVALRGEAPDSPQRDRAGPGHHLGESISWRRNRVPLIWRAPGASTTEAARVDTRLIALIDVPATLLSAAGLSAEPLAPGLLAFEGRAIGQAEGATASSGGLEERRILLSSRPFVPAAHPAPDLEVGLATSSALYARRASPQDGSGQPLTTAELEKRAARFAILSPPANPSASVAPPIWQDDILDANSPVPALEFHLARALRTAFSVIKGVR